MPWGETFFKEMARILETVSSKSLLSLGGALPSVRRGKSIPRGFPATLRGRSHSSDRVAGDRNEIFEPVTWR